MKARSNGRLTDPSVSENRTSAAKRLRMILKRRNSRIYVKLVSGHGKAKARYA
jgi:hypothetical protein